MNEIYSQIVAEDLAIIENKLIETARAKHKAQDFGGAINDYYKILEMNPNNKIAQTGIELLNQILNYYHKDSYNP